MTREEIISGLKMTADLFLVDPITGYVKTREELNDLDRISYDSCMGAISALSKSADIEKIRAEIEEKSEDDVLSTGEQVGLIKALEIIDKHIEGDKAE